MLVSFVVLVVEENLRWGSSLVVSVNDVCMMGVFLMCIIIIIYN